MDQTASIASIAPPGYHWIIERGWSGYQPFTGLQPWYLLDQEYAFNVSEQWPDGPVKDRTLVAFARRQDSDDLSCFEVRSGSVVGITMIHGWTAEGYEVTARFDSFWYWLKAIIDDIAEWCDQGVTQ